MKSLSADPTLPDPKRARFQEPAKFLPVAFVFSVIFGLWGVYVNFHCFRLMDTPKTYMKGLCQMILLSSVGLLHITCYIRCMLQHPGTLPDKDVTGDGVWDLTPQDASAFTSAAQGGAAGISPNSTTGNQEMKRSGDRRVCKWCGKYKPDRCHHCRVCRMCILKMDHHCPWIYNCVGFRNFKFFFLLIMYGVIALHVITWTMIPTVKLAIRDDSTPFFTMFMILFGETLAGFLCLLLTIFFGFHVWLMLKALTTIEWCEKSRRSNFDTSAYDYGYFRNICAVLGDNVPLWFLPCSTPAGDGLSFAPTEATPLRFSSRDMGSGWTMRRKTHQKGLQGQRAADTGSAPDFEEA